ncbi:MAG TPA: MFS transporter [Solirubrobacteraceae bacterium]|jgi:MFS family permease|nr:MFS transporter [Solirubrobacteraceae bacterium]
MLDRYRAVLSAPGCARVFATALLGRLPQGMSSLAILLLVRARTGSYAAAGVAVGAYALASAACAPVQGRLVDRLGRVRVLAPAAALQGLALLALVLAGSAPAPMLVGLAAIAGALLPSLAPTVRALLRELLSDRALRETAYSLESVIQELIWITGPLVVALVITFTSPAGAVLLSAFVCIAGTFLFLRTPVVRGGGPGRSPAERVPVLGIPALRVLLGPIALMGTSLGLIEVGLPSLALHAGSRPSSGLLLAFWSVGSMTGGLWYGSRTWRVSLGTRYRLLLLAAVAFTAPLMIARTIPEGMIFSLLAGLTISPVFACQYALIGHAVTPGVENEAFTWVAAALIAGLAAGSALGGAAISTGGVSAPFVLACGASALAALSATRLRTTVEQVSCPGRTGVR